MTAPDQLEVILPLRMKMLGAAAVPVSLSALAKGSRQRD